MQQQIDSTTINKTPVNQLTNKQIISVLANRFPKCFFVTGKLKPLKKGIFQDLILALEQDPILDVALSKTRIRRALRGYTASRKYLLACSQDNVSRVDLFGNDVGTLDTTEKEYARTLLNSQITQKIFNNTVEN